MGPPVAIEIERFGGIHLHLHLIVSLDTKVHMMDKSLYEWSIIYRTYYIKDKLKVVRSCETPIQLYIK